MGTTMTGCSSPCERIDAASSSSCSGANTLRGWSGFGSIASTATSRSSFPSILWSSAGTGVAAAVVVGVVRDSSSALSPRPSTLRGGRPVGSLVIFQDLLGQVDVAFGAARPHVVKQCRLAETGRFGEAHVARHDGFKHPVGKKLTQVLRDLLRQVH